MIDLHGCSALHLSASVTVSRLLDLQVVAMACVNLASKIEEAPRRIRDVINVCHHIKQVRNKK